MIETRLREQNPAYSFAAELNAPNVRKGRFCLAIFAIVLDDFKPSKPILWFSDTN